jgi:hypothetical protein
MSGEEHMVCLNRRSNKQAREWDYGQSQTLYEVLVHEGLSQLDTCSRKD